MAQLPTSDVAGAEELAVPLLPITAPIVLVDVAEGSGRQTGADDEEDVWLQELLTAHRPGVASASLHVPPPTSSTPDGGQTASSEDGDPMGLEELLSAHRHVATTLASATTAPVASDVALDGTAVATPASAASPTTRTVAATRQTAHTAPSIVRGRAPAAATSTVIFGTWCEVEEHLARGGRACDRTWTTPGQDAILWHGLRCICVPPLGHIGPWNPLDHVASRLCMWRRLLGAIAFKIGIAADPQERYHHPVHGYAMDGVWHFMDVVLEGPAQLCRQMERSLISACRGIQGCHNEAPGGEGVSPNRTHMCRVYVVVAGAGTGVGLAIAVAQRRLKRTRDEAN